MRPRPRIQDQTLNGLAATLPGAAAVFRRCGLRFTCSDGERTLTEAVAISGVSLDAMLGALEDLVGSARGRAPDETGALIEFIVKRHHDSCRAALPALIAAAAEVEHAEAGRADAPLGLAVLLDGLRASLDEHMLKEELRVFPMMREGRLEMLPEPLALMRDEHEDNAMFLLRLEELTRGYRLPPDAGPDWEKLYGDVEAFADDLVAHVFLEEQVLFPRFETARS